jgi:hypothetical protein
MENSQFSEQVFLQDIFRKDIYAIVFDYIDKEYNDIMEENEIEKNLDKINKILSSIINEEEFRYEVLYEEFTNKPRFEDQIDCITCFDSIALWNIVEYIRKKNNLMYMGNISKQNMIQKCSLAWAWIAEDIIENEWDDIIECYQNK